MSGSLLSNFVSLTGMSFRTYDNPNYRAAIYALSIRQPGDLALEYLTYTFPMSPESLRKEFVVMGATYDTQGTPQQLGVDREFDIFGQAPPIFTLEGSTGNKRHQTDGFISSGQDAIKALEKLLALFAQLNQNQISQSKTDMYTLELFDYFRNDYWRVVPEGPQSIHQSKDRPLYINYRLRFVGIKPVNAPPEGIADALANVFGGSAVATAANVASNLNSFTQLYAPSGLSNAVNSFTSSNGISLNLPGS